MQFAFEVPFGEVELNLDRYADALIASLESDFLVMPKGDGFIEFPVFETAYEALKKTTKGFRRLSADAVAETVGAHPVSFIVLRAMLGFTPPEWAHVATKDGTVEVTQGQARSIDRRVRMTVSLRPGCVIRA